MIPYSNKEIKRRITKALFVTTTAAMLAQPFTGMGTIHVYAQDGAVVTSSVGVGALSINTSTATTINISDVSRIKDVTVTEYDGTNKTYKAVVVNITQSGTYLLTGSNLINDAYVDVKLTVASGVTANLVFDGLTIQNDDSYCTSQDSSGNRKYSFATPAFEINGTANIYVKSNSTITMDAYKTTGSAVVINTGGILNMSEALENTSLTLSKGITGAGSLFMKEGKLCLGGAISGLKKVEMIGGCLEGVGITNTSEFCMSDGELTSYINAKKITISGGTVNAKAGLEYITGIGSGNGYSCDEINISGGNITAEAGNHSAGIGASRSANCGTIKITGGVVRATYGYNSAGIGKGNGGSCSKVIITGGRIADGTSISPSPVNAASQEVFAYTLSNLPKGKSITSINGNLTKDVTTTPEGTVSLYLPKATAAVIADGETFTFAYNSETNSFTNESIKPCNVIFKLIEDNTELETRQAFVGETLATLPVSEEYDYTFTLNDVAFTTATELTGDCTVLVTRTKKQFTVAIDGAENTYKYGSTLPAGKLYVTGTTIYTSTTPITSALTLTSYDSITVDGKEYLPIDSADRLTLFNSLVNAGNASLNGYVTADIDYGNKNWIALCSTRFGDSVFPYTGTFEGNGHTISHLNGISSEGFSGLCGYCNGTVQNVIVKDSTFNADRRSGCIAAYAGSNAVIKNCGSINNSASISEYFHGDGEGASGICCQLDKGSVSNCYAMNVTLTAANNSVAPIVFFGLNAPTISNCYYLADSDDSQGGKTAAQFASGEVCNLINNGTIDGTQVWYQNIDNGKTPDTYPQFSGGTVYQYVSAYSNLLPTSIKFKDSYKPSKTYDETALTNPTESDLTIFGAPYSNVTYTWYKDSVSEENIQTDVPCDAGSYVVKASIAKTDIIAASEATSSIITIAPKSVNSPTIELSQNSFVYDNTEKKPGVTVKNGNTIIPSGEYTVAYSNNINAGTATISITDQEGGNYSVNGSITFLITKTDSALTPVEGGISKEYDGNAFELSTTKGTHFTWDGTGTATIDGYYMDNTGTTKTSTENSGAAGEGAAPVNVGSYYAKVSVKTEENNYTSSPAYIPFTIKTKDSNIENLYGHSLSLSGNIGINLYMELAPEVITNYPDAYMLFTLPDGSTSQVKINQATQKIIDGKQYYSFTCKVNSKQMHDVVSAQMIFNASTKGNLYTYSVDDYVKESLASTDAEVSKAKDLMKAMSAYGAYAETYFDNKELSVTEEMQTKVNAVTGSALSAYVAVDSGSQAGINYTGSSLILESETSIRHYFQLEAGHEISEYTFTLGDTNVLVPVKKGDLYYVQISNITADNLDTMYTVKVGGFSIQYSALSYAYSALTNNSNSAEVTSQLQNLLKVLYLYNQEAHNYINK